MNKLVFSMALLLAALGLPASGPVAAASVLEEPVPVFVSILPQKYFVERVGGGRVAVQVLVRPGENPETFEPNQRQMAALSRARIYFLAGVPFERVWAGRVLKAHPGLNVVRMHRSIDPEAGRENPHLWLNPNWVRKMAAVIRDVLIVADPAGLEDYTAGHDRFVRDLMALDREIRESLAPVSSRHFMVYHPAWLHFARCYDLDEIPIEFEGKAPGP
ncbi:MAG: metal ABC transporter solute-binding protein, Zn/Mn family, partial [Nitrospinaceae bacterium]